MAPEKRIGGWIEPKDYCPLAREEICSAKFWRDVLAETWSSFLLMAMVCCFGLPWCKGDVGQGGTSTVTQAAIGMAGIVIGAAGSYGGDFGPIFMNPAIAFAHILSVKITIVRGVFYIIFECGAMIAATYFVKWLTPPDCRGNLSATLLHEGVHPYQGVMTEMWLTAFLTASSIGASNAGRKTLRTPSFTIGFTLAACVTCGYEPTGASMNPARSLGPAIAMNIWSNHWVYWVGPLAGGAFASLICSLMLDPLDHPGRVRHRTTDEREDTELQSVAVVPPPYSGSKDVEVIMSNKESDVKLEPSRTSNGDDVYDNNWRSYKERYETPALGNDYDVAKTGLRL